jgi:hypothetical protein
MVEIVLIFHFLVILFVLVGFPVGLKYNLRRFRIFHACVLIYISTLMLLGKPCSFFWTGLTPVEVKTTSVTLDSNKNENQEQ